MDNFWFRFIVKKYGEQIVSKLEKPDSPNVDLRLARILLLGYQESDNKRILALIPIHKIKQTSTWMSPEEIKSFSNLLEGNPMTPIELELDSHGNLTVNDGSHRLKAVQELGFKRIPAIVPTDWSEIDKVEKIIL